MGRVGRVTKIEELRKGRREVVEKRSETTGHVCRWARRLAGWLATWLHWVAKSGYQPPLAVLTERFAARYSLHPSPVDGRWERARGGRPRERERRSQPVAIPSEGFTLQY